MAVYVIVMIVFGVLLAVLVVAVLGSAVYQRFMPLEKKLADARRKLLANETSTGAAHLLTTIGLTDEQLKELAQQEGFRWTGYSGQRDRQLNFQRKVARTDGVPGAGPEFLKGPSLAELRRHPRAAVVAAEVKAATGVDPLSDDELEAAQAGNTQFRQRVTRWAGMAVLFGLGLLTLVLSTGKAVLAGSGDTPLVAGICALALLAGLGFSWYRAGRANAARKKATSRYAGAYEKLVSELLPAQ